MFRRVTQFWICALLQVERPWLYFRHSLSVSVLLLAGLHQTLSSLASLLAPQTIIHRVVFMPQGFYVPTTCPCLERLD